MRFITNTRYESSQILRHETFDCILHIMISMIPIQNTFCIGKSFDSFPFGVCVTLLTRRLAAALQGCDENGPQQS